MCADPSTPAGPPGQTLSSSPEDQLNRYQAEADIEGTWRVTDCMTGLPAASNGKDLIRLAKQDAQDLARELNDSEREGRPSPLL
jgi:hypothetical protein